jgi:predicted metal-dependent enzyme (double-stranded beta helix superfamily)
MIRRRHLVGLVGAVLFGGAAIGAGVAASSAQEDPSPIAVRLLTPRSTFTDDVSTQIRVTLDNSTRVLNVHDPSRIAVAEITVQPGARFPWHTHAGPVVVTVAQGELTYVNATDCVGRPYPAGTAFVDPGRGNVHTAYNSADGVTVVVATFWEVSADGPLTITDGVEAPEGCDFAAGAHGAH